MNLKELMDAYLATERAIEWAKKRQAAIKAAMGERIGVPVRNAYPNCNFITVAKRHPDMKVLEFGGGPASYEMVIDGVDVDYFEPDEDES